jgi:rSAM/selenodomain-associated transferase 1
MTAVLLFLKSPKAGTVKTRLAETVGADEALDTYRALVERQLLQLPRTQSTEIHFTPTGALTTMREWLGDELAYFAQAKGGLTERLSHGVSQAFSRGHPTVICIGGDCPQLEAAHFKSVEQLLEKGDDVVFGPTEDGGYYLIGMRAPYLELFQDIAWSTPETLKHSLKQARQLRLKVGMLETLYDVDTDAELKRARKARLI